ncbi:hypothetical protein MPTK2_1g24590 [Marchantia polymorpha subsp. ruderalis]
MACTVKFITWAAFATVPPFRNSAKPLLPPSSSTTFIAFGTFASWSELGATPSVLLNLKECLTLLERERKGESFEPPRPNRSSCLLLCDLTLSALVRKASSVEVEASIHSLDREGKREGKDT